MVPQFVKFYVKSNKSDAADAEAICEAVQRPGMRFVSAKSIGQQRSSKPAQHSQSGRTAQSSQIRGQLMEYGLTLSQGIFHIRKSVPSILESVENELTVLFRGYWQIFTERCLKQSSKPFVFRTKFVSGYGVFPVWEYSAPRRLVAAIGDINVFIKRS